MRSRLFVQGAAFFFYKKKKKNAAFDLYSVRNGWDV